MLFLFCQLHCKSFCVPSTGAMFSLNIMDSLLLSLASWTDCILLFFLVFYSPVIAGEFILPSQLEESPKVNTVPRHTACFSRSFLKDSSLHSRAGALVLGHGKIIQLTAVVVKTTLCRCWIIPVTSCRLNQMRVIFLLRYSLSFIMSAADGRIVLLLISDYF